MNKWVRLGGIGLALLIIGGAVVWAAPDLRGKVSWRVRTWYARAYALVFPPEKEVFLPATPRPQPVVTLVPTLPPAITLTFTPLPSTATPSPVASPTPTLTPTAIPDAVRLEGVIHEYQKWNNCGPATLAMLIRFWGWQGDQRDTAPALKPDGRDKNVSPDEMMRYVNEQTGLRALMRMGGDEAVLKRLIAAGFPVVVERGWDDLSGEGWLGHYQLLTAYEDERQRFVAQDSLILPDLPVPYAELQDAWRAFNNVWLVVYPAEREGEVLSALGPYADEAQSIQMALDKAVEETQSLSDREQFFAWFNRGTNLTLVGDYAGAAQAYDEAFLLNATLPEDIRPWRMMWYQFGPYQAYYEVGRYDDVIRLATFAVGRTAEPALEESYYWRGRAKAALGDVDGARADWRVSLDWHPGYEPSLQALEELQ
jgi:hypothetical protein